MGPPEPATPPIAKIPSRTCVGCGRNLAWDANVCPHCGQDYRFQSHQLVKPARMSSGMRILVYLLSFFIPFIGIIIGVILYASSKEDDYAHVGKICILISLWPLFLLLVCWFYGAITIGPWLTSLIA